LVGNVIFLPSSFKISSVQLFRYNCLELEKPDLKPYSLLWAIFGQLWPWGFTV